jgi:hypothetical protein
MEGSSVATLIHGGKAYVEAAERAALRLLEGD